MKLNKFKEILPLEPGPGQEWHRLAKKKSNTESSGAYHKKDN